MERPARVTRFEKADRLAAVIFRRLPSTTSRQAQDARRLAKEIAADIISELARLDRTAPKTQALGS